ncbi:MAG: EAL domain-containing protein [Acidobacteriota bacterium]|nr:EAL domain-containing protein [Acidobacteriota bacterium]
MNKTRYAKVFQWTIIVLGALVITFSARRIQVADLDLRFLLLSLITICVGSRITIQIPRVKGHISVSDTFIFLAILLFGSEAAILLAAAEALCSSFHFTKKKLTIMFNASVMACSTFLAVWTVQIIFGKPVALQEGYTALYVVGLCAMALVQYGANSGMVAVAFACKTDQPLWLTWRKHFLWTSITYFAGASAAGIIAKLIGAVGFYAFLATTPIIAIVYFTYCTYLKNIEASNAQTEQAERHIEALRESEERFRSAFDYATIGMALASPEGRWLQVNHSLCEILGYTEEELLADTFQKATHAEDLDAVLSNVGQLIEGKIPSYQTQKRYLHKQGHVVWSHLGVSLIRDAQGNSLRLLFQVQDITDRKRAEDQLVHDAFHDALTGLPNRALFMDHLKMAINRSKRNDERLFAALFLDLDRFKIINDSLGHMVGDQLLVGIARRLESCLRPGDTVARLGGDEFTILLEDLTGAGEASEIAGRVQAELSVPFNLSGHEVFTTASIGIALSTIGYERAEDLLRDADTAMYRAKTLGKKRHEMFDRAMHDRAVSLLQLETDLRRAVERNEFVLEYQPIVSVETNAIRGFEALVRWRHPERGFIPPAEFIPMAEETGLIIPIGQWVLNEACRQMREWQDKLFTAETLTMSVNLSGKQFTQPDLIEQISKTLRDTKLDPRSLKLEITESMVMENIETAIDMLQQIRALGVELSIDDFGTGYSSLSYLHRFPIDTLKIDRSFVSCMNDNSENFEIVRTIITLARSLEMDVIAEGVETENQLQQLRNLECDYVQGYLLSHPLGADAAFELLGKTRTYARPALPAEIPIHPHALAVC